MIDLKNVRLSFPGIFEAKPFKPGDKPRFKATFLVPKGSAQDKMIANAIEEAATAKWGAKAKGILASIRNNPNKFGYQDGDTRTYDGYEGMMALTASNTTRPLVIDRDKSVLTVADGRPYGGCYVNARVEIFCYSNSGNGISMSLSGVQFYKDGDAFGGGRPSDADDFEEVTDESGEDLA